MSKVIKGKADIEELDKETSSLSSELRGALKKIEEKKEYWKNVFDKNNIRYVTSENGFIIDEKDHHRALQLLKLEKPISAETAALFFNYADLSQYNE